ncbi:hypothetical protein MOQ_002531 [Trypanosoma cruzi marinkellei]|uniref:Uncharacterized protein n=1 Tax=Trypanosoma cruzi marinkellei TaxID=85056 RepID=K2MEF3_TRYCR|nr:hypothetical protein MOQ_002531 [Trypanosoma cruzi marinkellei]
MRLSRRVQLNPEVIDSSLQRLNCVSQNIIEVDISPTVLALLTSVAPDVVRQRVAELPPRDVGDIGKEEAIDFGGAGMNTALALSLHTVLLSRNRLTTTLGLVQFKNVVRLSLLGNRVQRIEDCEALSLLPSLQYLTLEFNPVTSLPHYRAHILRICSWPDTLNSKNCRLRKLDTRSVLPAEVERAAQCLQREKVTLGELVHRMRFLALLTEADKRIALHNEIRRRGFMLQDSFLTLTVERIVTRCSAQLLALVDVSSASHLARRLMGGKCRICAVTPDSSFDDDNSNEKEFSQLATSFGHSLSSSKILSLQHPYQAELTAFCKDWSRDVFRRATTSLDHRICGLLLNIAHTLGEELTVMDVDYLNKLWFTQIAKVDSCKFYQFRNLKEKPMANGNAPTVAARREKPCEGINGSMKESTWEEFVRVPLSPSDTHSHAPRVEAMNGNEDVLSLRSISPITQQTVKCSDAVASRDWQKSSCDAPEHSSQKQPKLDKAPNDGINGDEPKKSPKVEECNSDWASIEELPLMAPVPFPAPKDELALEQELFHKLKCHVRRRILCMWKSKVKRKQQETLCANFIQKRFEGLLLLSTPTPHAISSTLQFLPRKERKRVLFQFWREQARLSYAPRLLRLSQLFSRWRWRTYQHDVINYFTAKRRTRTLNEVWRCWAEALHVHIAGRRNRSEEKIHNIAALPDAMSGFQSPDRNGCSRVMISSDRRLKEPHNVFLENCSSFKVTTDATPGLTCSTKPSVNGACNVPQMPHLEGTPAIVFRSSLPMVIPNMVRSPSVQPPFSCEKATQTTMPHSNDGVTEKCKDEFCLEAKKAVEAMQADRLRLVDRLIALEQRVCEESLRVQHREEEIEDLKQKLKAMTVREECVGSTIGDYQREIEHLKVVIRALREERREMLRSSFQ